MKRSFGIQLRKAREAKGYTQKVLAPKLGIEANSLARVERGLAGLGWPGMEKIPSVLGQPASYFFSDAPPEIHVQEIGPDQALDVLAQLVKTAANMPNISDFTQDELESLKFFVESIRKNRSESANKVRDQRKKLSEE